MIVAQMTYVFRNMIMELDRDYPNKVDMLETVNNVLYVSNLERCKDKDMIAELILQQHERTDFEKWDTVATRAATVIKNNTNIAYVRDTHKEEGNLEAHVASEKPRQQCFNCGGDDTSAKTARDRVTIAANAEEMDTLNDFAEEKTITMISERLVKTTQKKNIRKATEKRKI